MKAVIYEQYGSPEVLKIKEIIKPDPGPNELLIMVYATTVTAGDWRLRRATPFLARLFNGLLRPKKVQILGFEFSGIVADIGASVTKYKVGDEVYGSCGFKFGAYSEYMTISESGLISKKPEDVSYEKAAAISIGALSANRMIEQAHNLRNKRVMVYGASGSVGSYLVQMIKHAGAEVIGVCSTKNLDVVKGLGADDVIDYTKDSLEDYYDDFDVVFDAVGKLKSSVRKKLVHSLGETYSINHVRGNPKHTHMTKINTMLEQGSIEPLIDKVYKLDQIVEAHRYVESFRKVGNVVIDVGLETHYDVS